MHEKCAGSVSKQALSYFKDAMMITVHKSVLGGCKTSRLTVGCVIRPIQLAIHTS